MQTYTKQTARDREVLQQLTQTGRVDSRGAQNHVSPTNTASAHPPADFQFPYVVGRPTPYHVCDEDGRAQLCGGVLPTGQVVWLRQPVRDAKASRQVTAFTHTAGLILLETRRLAEVRRPL